MPLPFGGEVDFGGGMRRFAYGLTVAVFLGAVVAAGAPAQAFQAESGFDLIARPQSAIRALNRTAFLSAPMDGLRFGQSIYSAAAGDAGGAFFWGYEAGADLAFSPRLTLRARGFAGGGGGAGQVTGDGFMVRAGLGLSYSVTDRLSFDLGAAWLHLEGARLDGMALSLGLSLHDPVAAARHGLRLTAAGAGFGIARLSGPSRSGQPHSPLVLAGAQARFALPSGLEATLATAGAASGGEGYMQVTGGLRATVPLGPLQAYAEGALGFGGGGDVDTGGGALAMAGIGLVMPLGGRHMIDLGVAGMTTAGSARGAVATLRLDRRFGADAPPQAWRLSTGLVRQIPNAGFRRGGRVGPAPVLQETAIDMLLSPKVYLSGTACTALGGDVAGYAIGLVGLGYEAELSPFWSLSVEAQAGAAGGGGVDAAGGAVLGLRAEVDYRLSRSVSVSLAVGGLRSLGGTGMAPGFVQLGFKLPFTTH